MNTVKWGCPYPGCNKQIESVNQPFCKHGLAEVSMQQIVEIGSLYDDKSKPSAKDSNTNEKFDL